MAHLSEEEAARPLRNLSDAAIAGEVKRVGLLEEVSAEEGAHIDALIHEVMRRFVERRVWLGPGVVFAPDGIHDGPLTMRHDVD